VLEEIVLMEWEMFRTVTNVGGAAPCQKNQKTFFIMRLSQLMTWTDKMMACYLEDLREALKDGRNLMAEKYGRMMQDTFPEEYRNIEGQLPSLNPEALSLADRIADLMVEWTGKTQQLYPKLVRAGRPIENSESASRNTSLKTYLRSELLTYGIQTLTVSWEHFSWCLQNGINGYEAVLLNMVRMYGYNSLEHAEAHYGAVSG
jgi:hypothetical protein